MRLSRASTTLFTTFSARTAAAWLTGQAVRQDSPLFSTSKDASTASTTAPSLLPPPSGSVVTIDCRLVPEGDFIPEPLIDGVVLHETDPAVTLTFVLDKGNYLPGLHETVAKMSELGETVQDVSLDAGWGERNPNLVATIGFEASGMDKSMIKQGTQLMLANGVKAVVTEVQDESFVIDANPPLAGASYQASVKLINVEPGPIMEEFGEKQQLTTGSPYRVATFALGCFWGGELEFMREPGVVGTAVGYTHGHVEDPTYQQVCTGTTGHTEAIAVTYDSKQISYERLVRLAMDRLAESKYLLNQVGNDRGTQYRHGVYYHDEEQMAIAREIVTSFGDDCVTECLPAKKFWFAEDYHQQYLLKGGQSARKGDKEVIRCYG